jgi:nucleoside-diphosphate-sugar epimerase
MKVLILGATGESLKLSRLMVGFIGLPAAQAFVRSGHIVYGQTRSEKSTAELVKEEIIPVVLDPGSDEGVEAFVKVAKDVDVGEFIHLGIRADGSNRYRPIHFPRRTSQAI